MYTFRCTPAVLCDSCIGCNKSREYQRGNTSIL